MTQNPGQSAGTAPGASGLDRFFGWLRALDLRRDTDDKWLAGVCSGIATRLGVDPLVVRAVLIVLILFGGVGVTLYLVAWAFVPNVRGEVVAERAIRHGDVGGIILLVVLALSLLPGPRFGNDGWGLWWLWWIVVPVGLLVWFVTRRNTSNAMAPGASTWVAAAPTEAQPHATTWSPATGHAPQAPAPGFTPQAPTSPPEGPTAPAPYAVAPPPRPRRPRRRSAGFLGAVVVGGLALGAYGLAVWGHQHLGWGGDEHVVGLASALTVVGVALLGMGVAGYRAGLTALLAVVLTLATWTASLVPNLTVGGGVGDRTWRPSAADTRGDYRLGIGSGALWLGDLPNNPATPRQVHARIGVGELRILVPQDLTVQVRSSVGAGHIGELPSSPLGDTGGSALGVGSAGRDGRDISTTETIGEGTPDVVVTATVGLGQILVGKE